MLTNKISRDGICPTGPQSPVRLRKRGRESDINQHAHLTKPKYIGKWNIALGDWSGVKTEYVLEK